MHDNRAAFCAEPIEEQGVPYVPGKDIRETRQEKRNDQEKLSPLPKQRCQYCPQGHTDQG